MGFFDKIAEDVGITVSQAKSVNKKVNKAYKKSRYKPLTKTELKKVKKSVFALIKKRRLQRMRRTLQRQRMFNMARRMSARFRSYRRF